MLMDRLGQELDKGLTKETHKDAIVKCFTTYVQDLPNGTGTGIRIFLYWILSIGLGYSRNIENRSNVEPGNIRFSLYRVFLGMMDLYEYDVW